MYSYLKCIVYDKLLKPRQSFRITLYIPPGLTLKKISGLLTECVDAFCMDVKTKSDFCPVQH